MKLAIISDCIHVYMPDGTGASDNHIFVRQMHALAEYFTEVHIFCPFVNYCSSLPVTKYTKQIFFFHPLKKVGGNKFADKLNLLKQIPTWFSAFKKANALSDVVYQRFPNNLNIIGVFYFFCVKKPVFATYTGTWEKNAEESLTYTFQKWLLKKMFRGPVGVYSLYENKSAKIFNSFSPSYSLSEWAEETDNVNNKVKNLLTQGLPLLSMVTVGSFVSYKNQMYILNTCVMLKAHNIPFHLYMVGDGELRISYEKFIQENNLISNVTITGKLTYKDVRSVYRKVSLVVQAPLVEGFGKVPIEGYFHGTIPVINNISLASYLTGNGRLGYLFSTNSEIALYELLVHIYNNPHELIKRLEESRLFVQEFTLENWAQKYYNRIVNYYPKLRT